MGDVTRGDPEFCAALIRLLSASTQPSAKATILDGLLPDAPVDLRPHLEVLRAGVQPFVDNPGYTMTQWNNDHITAEARALNQASSRIDVWLRSRCAAAPPSYARAFRPATDQTTDVARQARHLTEQCGAATGLRLKSATLEDDSARVISVVIPHSGASTELSTVWRWFQEAERQTGLLPVVLAREALEFRLHANLGVEELITAANGIDAVALLASQAAHTIAPDTATTSIPMPATLRSFDLAASIGGTRPMLCLVPANAHWEIAALIALGDGGRFQPHEHVAVLRHFEERYSAVLAATSGAMTTLALPEPVRDPETAQRAASERLAYATSTFGLVEYEPHEVVAATQVDDVWGFWWD